MVTIKNLSTDARAVAYGVVNGPKVVEPGATVLIYEWALTSYTGQPYWEEVTGPQPVQLALETSKEE